MYTPKTIGDAVRDHIRAKYKRQKVAAAQWGLSETMVSQVVCGTRRPTAAMLADMGLDHTETYVPVGAGQPAAQSLGDRVDRLEKMVSDLNSRTVGLIRMG